MGYTTKSYTQRQKDNNIKIIFFIVFILLMFGASAGCAYGTVDKVEFTVSKSERVTTGAGDSLSSKYLVFTDVEVFENSDSLWHMKWNSSDLYSKMQEGKTYTATVYGFRIPFLSSYRNIIEAYELPQPKAVKENEQ